MTKNKDLSKAYEVSYDDGWDTGSTITFARTAGQAKGQVELTDEVGNMDFIDLKARRVPWADKYWNRPQNELILAELHMGWTWDIGSGYRDVSEEDIPAIIKAGGFNEYVDLYLAHKVVPIAEKERLEVTNG